MFKTKIYAGIAIIVVLGLLAMLYIYRSLGDVAGYLRTLDNVGVPFSIAALEMEKNTGEYADGVLRYINDPDPAVRDETLHDINDFTERHAIFMRLATTERERSLGTHVAAEHVKLTRMGDALMDQRDRLDALFDQTTTLLEQIDVLIDGRMQRELPADEPAYSRARAAIANIEAETAEVGFWMTLFRARPTETARTRLVQKLGEQHNAVWEYRKLPLGAEAGHLASAVLSLHEQVATNVNALLPGETQISRRAIELEQLAEDIDEVFDEKIQIMLMEDLAAPQEHADEAIEQVQATFRYLIPAYFLVAAFIGIFLIVASIRPLKRLAAGTDAIGTGNLGHRIDVRGNDEFAQLARQFNRMAARLQESTVSRDLLEASEQRLQQTVIELRQEIAERRQAEREREQLQSQLQRTETLTAMGRLVAGVAHEVRNPLFGISSTLDAMDASAEAGSVDPRYREVLKREAKRLNKLMSELLEYGRTPPSDTLVEPLGKTLAEAIRNCLPSAEPAAITVTNRARADALVNMNHDRLLQVFVNLIENAIQHAPQGSEVAISTAIVHDPPGREWIECHVTDSGSGFADDDLPFVFDPFFTRRRRGTGLGLAIVQRIVDEHHGSVTPGNRAAGGAIVTVRLPVAAPDPHG